MSCGTAPTEKGLRKGIGQSFVCAMQKEGGGWESTPLYPTVGDIPTAELVYLGGSADLSRVFLQPHALSSLKEVKTRFAAGEACRNL